MIRIRFQIMFHLCTLRDKVQVCSSYVFVCVHARFKLVGERVFHWVGMPGRMCRPASPWQPSAATLTSVRQQPTQCDIQQQANLRERKVNLWSNAHIKGPKNSENTEFKSEGLFFYGHVKVFSFPSCVNPQYYFFRQTVSRLHWHNRRRRGVQHLQRHGNSRTANRANRRM